MLYIQACFAYLDTTTQSWEQLAHTWTQLRRVGRNYAQLAIKERFLQVFGYMPPDYLTTVYKKSVHV